MSDSDEKIAIENMPFFLEGLAGRFENEECPTLPKLCRAVATEIERLQARVEGLEKVVEAADIYINGEMDFDAPFGNPARWKEFTDTHAERLKILEQALAALKT